MLKRYQRTIGVLLMTADAAIVITAWLASYWSRFFLPSLPITKGLPPFETYASLTPLIGVMWVIVFSSLRVYEWRRTVRLGGETGSVLHAHAVALVCFIALTYLFKDYQYSRLVMIYFAVLGAVGLVGFHLATRALLRRLRARGHNLRRVLAVGAGHTLEQVIARIGRFPELGLRVTGIAIPDGTSASQLCGKPVLGTISQVTSLIADWGIDEVLIALPPSNQQEIEDLLELLKDETVDIRLVPDVHRYVTLGCDVEDFDGLPVVRLNDSPLVGWAAWAKRATDFTVAAVGLVAMSPVLLLLTLLVKLTSRGPILYSQERMGLDGRTFRMLKFRSMRVDAESASGAVWAKAKDERRTRFGTLLRKTSLDELPQLWNVLCGDMSLVGPRPERPVFVRKFRSEIPHYMLRHKVKSGITGWAQVNGWRGNTSLDRRIECDLFYIKNWSYTLDIKILTMTLWRGFIDKNAY